MPAGDSARTWFPEMLEQLEREWSLSMSWDECGDLCLRMTEARTKLRMDKGIANPKMRCRHCDEVREMTLAPLTIRSMLFALRKQGRLSDEELSKLDKEWQRYRSKNRLDARARRIADGAPNADSASVHEHL